MKSKKRKIIVNTFLQSKDQIHVPNNKNNNNKNNNQIIFSNKYS